MQIDEIKKLKRELEYKIGELLAEFEKKTKLMPGNISHNRRLAAVLPDEFEYIPGAVIKSEQYKPMYFVNIQVNV